MSQEKRHLDKERSQPSSSPLDTGTSEGKGSLEDSQLKRIYSQVIKFTLLENYGAWAKFYHEMPQEYEVTFVLIYFLIPQIEIILKL